MLWSAWLPDVLPKVPGCPIPIIEHELRRAAQTFFERSRCRSLTLATIAIAGGDTDKTLTMTDATEQAFVRVEQAWYDGVEMDIYTPEDLDRMGLEDWTDDTGTPSALVQFSPEVVRLYPIPSVGATTGLKVRVSIKPADTATAIPDEYGRRYRDALMVGALARLMMYAKSAWADPAMAAGMAAAFEEAISKALLDAARSFGKGRLTSKVRWY